MLAKMVIAGTVLMMPHIASAQTIKTSSLVQRADRAASSGMSYSKPSADEICLTRKSNGERVCKTRLQWRAYAAKLDQDKAD